MNFYTKGWFLVIVSVCIILVGLSPATIRFLRARSHPSPNSCLNELRKLDAGKQQWAIENHKTTNDTPALAEIVAYCMNAPRCPRGGTYTIGRVGEPISCSIPDHAKAWLELTESKK